MRVNTSATVKKKRNLKIFRDNLLGAAVWTSSIHDPRVQNLPIKGKEVAPKSQLTI